MIVCWRRDGLSRLAFSILPMSLGFRRRCENREDRHQLGSEAEVDVDRKCPTADGGTCPEWGIACRLLDFVLIKICLGTWDPLTCSYWHFRVQPTTSGVGIAESGVVGSCIPVSDLRPFSTITKTVCRCNEIESGNTERTKETFARMIRLVNWRVMV